VHLTNSVVSGNVSSSNAGGGIDASSGTLTLTGTTVSGNSAVGGGGIAPGGTTSIVRSTVSGNVSTGIGAGGGILNSGTLTVTNSTISGNTAGAGGGGGMASAGTASLLNATLSGNATTGNGGGIVSAGTVSLRATILNSGSAGANCGSGSIVSLGSNLSNDTSCQAAFNQVGDQNNVSLSLSPLAFNGGLTQTHALLDGSPAIDAVQGACTTDGTATGGGITSDQRSITRPQGIRCDAGAFELQGPGKLQFRSTASVVSEAGPTAPITIERIGGQDGNVSAILSVQDGSATAPADFSSSPIIVSFGSGATSATVQVPIVDDAVHENDETVNLTLGSFTGGAGAGSPSTAVLTILDNDSASIPPPTPLACAPRPPVSIASANTGDGRLRVAVTAGTASPNDANRLTELRFQAGTNALIDVAGQTGRSGPFTVTLTEHPTSITFDVQRATPGQPTTLPFIVADTCGDWPTFVGGGPRAF
jgi:hypothetical protein